MNDDDDLMASFHSDTLHDNVAVPDGLCWVSVLSCLLLACSYVGSLYVWKSDLPRDHPAVIKRRFTSVLIVSALSPLFVWAWKVFTGIQVLFLGPLIQLTMDCPWGFIDGIKVVVDPCFWTLCLSDMRWLRNQVVAPLTEELVFRACMLPMLVPCAGPSTAIFTCPLFFGVAHFHHVIELLRFRQGTVSGIFLSAVFQFSYTAVFGAYTAFIFIRTGHLVGPVLCHSFCNYMGFPALSTALEHPHRLSILSFYVLGVILFLLLLFVMTDPLFYGLPTPVCTLTSTAGSICS
ncbi:CAAX prenyl protease 2-like isoform X2 [Myxocyprinus asiaticus]|uniref:CAAX prenyl protease 2-like isoform X2 n=1 Tax=Myxocyprinus asiaticus TaxID=70543 RepID=UPI0022235635|nr:CAAX prenyl protease 2-like isoform X2 [Myxocyprinus asiaticus]